MKTFNIRDNNQEEIKKFIIELYKIYETRKYNFRFVINSSLLELYSKQFISAKQLELKLRDIEISIVEIVSGPVTYKITPYNIEEITIDDEEIKVKSNEDVQFRIVLSPKK